MGKILSTAASLLMVSGVAWAFGDDAPSGEPNAEAVRMLDTAGKSCAQKGGVCLTAGAKTVAATEPAGAKAVPRFAHAGQVAKLGGQAPPASGPWTIDVVAALKRPALKGNALFLFFDGADPKAVAEHSTTAMFQAQIPAGKILAAQLTLGRDDGFRAGHTYKVRVAQLIGGKEVLLAEAEFGLQ